MARGRVLGAQSLRRKLKRMPDHIKGPVQDAIWDGAEVIYADALKDVPVDHGYLAEALHKKRSGDGLSARVGYWMKGNKRKWRKGGWRAKFIEFGTVDQPARPFLGPAARSNEAWIVRRIRMVVDKALKRASNL